MTKHDSKSRDATTRFNIAKELENSLHKSDCGKYMEYADGISDETIATKYGVKTSVVAYMRKEIFGGLKPSPQSSPLASLAIKVQSLEKRIEDLERAATTPARPTPATMFSPLDKYRS